MYQGKQPSIKQPSAYLSLKLMALEEELRTLAPFNYSTNKLYANETMRLHGAILGLKVCESARNPKELDDFLDACAVRSREDTPQGMRRDRNTRRITGLLQDDIGYVQQIGLPHSYITNEECQRWFVAGFYESVKDRKNIMLAREQAADGSNATRPVRTQDYSKFLRRQR